jgi:hypothetical protein
MGNSFFSLKTFKNDKSLWLAFAFFSKVLSRRQQSKLSTSGMFSTSQHSEESANVVIIS